MVSGVLSLGERSIRSIMTPRTEVSWIDAEAGVEEILQELRNTPHSFFPVCRGDLDNILGIGRAKDLLTSIMDHGGIGDVASLRQPIIVHESARVLKIMETLRQSPGQLILVTDEYGAIQGLVTPIDILEAIAGEFPDEDEQPAIQGMGAEGWRVDGSVDLHYLAQVLQSDAWIAGEEPFSSLAGFLLDRFGQLPEVGDSIEIDAFRFEVAEVTNRRIAIVMVSRLAGSPELEEAGVAS